MSDISEQLARKVMRLDEEVGRTMNRLQKAHEEIEKLKEQIESYKGTFLQQGEALRENQKDIDSSESEIVSLEEENHLYESEIVKLESDNENLKKVLKEYRYQEFHDRDGDTECICIGCDVYDTDPCGPDCEIAEALK